jgi:D-glycero-alpha-D-manno-heptose-7-phosphate kinase
MKILASAPARISLIGGGTDLAGYADQFGGSVLSMAINLKSRVELFTGDDMWNEYNVFPQSCSPGLCYKIREEYGLNSMHHSVVKSSFDGRIGAGLGSSGSFAVALIAALERLSDRTFDRNDVAEKAYQIEVNKLKKMGGRQDQFAAAFGGLNIINFNTQTTVTPLFGNLGEWLHQYMILFYLGGERKSEDLQNEFKELTPQKINYLHSMKKLVSPAVGRLAGRDIEGFASLLKDAWELKKLSNEKVSNEKIDEIYQQGLQTGALAGKLLGAGKSGYFLFLIKPEERKKLIGVMKERGIEEIDFMPDWQGVEARVV